MKIIMNMGKLKVLKILSKNNFSCVDSNFLCIKDNLGKPPTKCSLYNLCHKMKNNIKNNIEYRKQTRKLLYKFLLLEKYL